MKDYRAPAERPIGAAICRAAIELALDPMRAAARGLGYAIAVHGSLARDVDLVAVPWTEQAAECDELKDTLLGVLRGIFGRATCYREDWVEKPHGRRAIGLYGFVETQGIHVHFDLSVTPKLTSPPKENEA